MLTVEQASWHREGSSCFVYWIGEWFHAVCVLYQQVKHFPSAEWQTLKANWFSESLLFLCVDGIFKLGWQIKKEKCFANVYSLEVAFKVFY